MQAHLTTIYHHPSLQYQTYEEQKSSSVEQLPHLHSQSIKYIMQVAKNRYASTDGKRVVKDYCRGKWTIKKQITFTHYNQSFIPIQSHKRNKVLRRRECLCFLLNYSHKGIRVFMPQFSYLGCTSGLIHSRLGGRCFSPSADQNSVHTFKLKEEAFLFIWKPKIKKEITHAQRAKMFIF